MSPATRRAWGRLNSIREPLIIMGVPFLFSLVFLKYSPVIFFGSIVGMSIHALRFYKGRTKGIYAALSVYALLYLALGLPVNGARIWPGALFWSDLFNQFCIFAANAWNSFPLNRYAPLLLIRKVTILGVKEYGWISFYVAVFYSMSLILLQRFRVLKREPLALLELLLWVPTRIFSWTTQLSFGFWVKVGEYAHRDDGSPIIAFTGTLLVGLIGYQGWRLGSNIHFIDLKWILSVASFLPLVGCVVGWILGAPLIAERIDAVVGKKKEVPRGFTLGTTFEGKPYRLTERNLGYHVEIVAPTGSGKTNLLKGLIADRIQKGHGLIFLDYKAEFEMISWVFRLAKSVNRENEIRLLSLSNRDLSVPYNPIRDGDATDIHSSLMNAMSWSEQYYRSIASVALMTVIKSLCAYRDKTREYFHLGHIYELLDQPGTLRSFADRVRALDLPGVEKLEVLASRLDKPAEREKLTGLMANLDQLLNSSAGELLSTDVVHGSYGVFEAILDGRITIMLMNSLKLKESAKVIGKTIVQDFIRYVGNHYAQIEQKKIKPITLIIDEFANCAIPEFIELLDRARGAGIGIVVAHQARADLREISPEFQSRIEANSNTTLVSGVKDAADAEYYAGMLGTRTVIKETSQKREGLFGDESTGVKSTREAEEFVLHPNRLKTLNQGQLFAVSRIIDPQWGMVNVFKAPEFEDFTVNNADLIGHLKQVRQSYLNQEGTRYLDLNVEGPSVDSEQSVAVEASVAETWN